MTNNLQHRFYRFLVFSLLTLCTLYACREDYDYINYGAETNALQDPESSDIEGLYILNEGNMGSNKATIDFFSYTTGRYTKNYYNQQNPTVVGSLGDVGNDIKIYRNKLFAVINLSNYVEVMDARTAKHIGEIKIINCRYINFHEGYAYITSYGGAVGQAQNGFVYKVDVETLEIVDKVEVGLQPDELEVVDNLLYVANSGGYSYPNYDNTVSVIDLKTFKEIKKIEVAVNLHRIKKDDNGKLWITSRGNYASISPKLYAFDPKTEQILKEMDLPVSDFAFVENRMYYYSSVWTAGGSQVGYGIIDTDQMTVTSSNFILNNAEQQIVTPYAITVNPINGDVLIADAKDYVSPGELFCFTKYGQLKWKTTTGDIPGHFAWLYR